MRKRTYGPTSGVQQRKKLLREVSRKKPRSQFSVSLRETRQAVAKMFDFVPLFEPNSAELSLLKKFTMVRVLRYSNLPIETAIGIISGKTKMIRRGRKVTPKRKTRIKLFSDVKTYETELYDGVSYGSQGSGSRGVKEYGADVLKLAKEVYKRKKAPVLVLDVGSATAKMLGELKAKMKDKVETHALTPVDEPKYKVDAYHMLTAEFLPKEFKEKFDIILSQVALEYAILPNLALKNISQALAPGGIADIQWRHGRSFFTYREAGDREKNFFIKYKESTPSKETKELIREAMEGGDKRKITLEQAEEEIDRFFRYNHLMAAQSMVWCNEVAKLQKNPNLKVKILYTTAYVPGRIIIEKKA